MLPLCVFHPRCEAGLAALEMYKREWDSDKKCFRASPLHDWTADGADAARYMALAWKPAPLRVVKVPMLEGWRIPPPPEPQRGRIRL
jgi:phage terminase large subunit